MAGHSHIRIWLHEIQRKRKKNFCQRKKIYIFIVQGFCATAYNIHIKKKHFPDDSLGILPTV